MTQVRGRLAPGRRRLRYGVRHIRTHCPRAQRQRRLRRRVGAERFLQVRQPPRCRCPWLCATRVCDSCVRLMCDSCVRLMPLLQRRSDVQHLRCRVLPALHLSPRPRSTVHNAFTRKNELLCSNKADGYKDNDVYRILYKYVSRLQAVPAPAMELPRSRDVPQTLEVEEATTTPFCAR